MLHKQEAPRLVTEATSKAVHLTRLNSFDNNQNLRDFQAQYVCARWEHISVPVARVIAELAFSARGRA